MIALPALTIFALLFVFISDSFGGEWRGRDSEKAAQLREALGRRRTHSPVKTL
jgi:hypothetical protein